MVLAVALGGALGALARYGVMVGATRLVGIGFPWGTLAVNVVGSVAMGLLVEVMALVWSPGPEVRAFLVVGVLGAFTTFSTFSLDVVVLAQRGEAWAAAAYVAASLILCIGGLIAGLRLARALLA
ncbi:MAG: fluoride efflux transporter CrcB [Inquilinaceae bacterium]